MRAEGGEWIARLRMKTPKQSDPRPVSGTNEGGHLLKFVGYLWSYPQRYHVMVWFGNYLREGFWRMSGVVEELATYPYLFGFERLDRKDECRARQMRQSLGLRRCVVSWERQHDGQWRARLSGPRIVVTIERTAKSRGLAILRAETAMNRILSSHPVNNMPPSPEIIDPS